MAKRIVVMVVLGLVTAVGLHACGPVVEPPPGGKHPWDVRGNYAVTHDNTLTLTLNVGSAQRQVTAQGYGNVVDFGQVNGMPVTLDLSAFCARPEVVCPAETFWSAVAVDLQEPNRMQDLHVINVINNMVRTLPAGQRAQVLGGLVNHAEQDRFVLGLGAQSGQQGDCAALAVSLAGGRFSRVGEMLVTQTVYQTPTGAPCNPDAGAPDAAADADGGAACAPVAVQRLTWEADAGVEGIKEGRVVLAWLGGCAFGPALVGATLSLESTFSALRTGEFDPPPFTPVPATLPDGGLPDAAAAGDAGETVDAGSNMDAGG